MRFSFLFALLVTFPACSQITSWDDEMVEITNIEQSGILMNAKPLFDLSWNTLPQPNFWKEIMLLAPDSCLINVASTRVVLAKMSNRDWGRQSEIQKTIFKDSVKLAHKLDENEKIFITTGKNDFYLII